MSVEQPRLLTQQQREVQEIEDQLRDCALYYSGVGITYDDRYIMNHLSEVEFDIVLSDFSNISAKTFFTTIAQSTAYPIPPTVAESSDSPPFVIAVFITGDASDSGESGTLHTSHGSVNIVDDIIKPFLPQSAPHLVHVPKLFFISSIIEDVDTTPPSFPYHRDGNYCVAYHTSYPYHSIMDEWMWHIADHLFRFDVSVEEVVENSRSCLYEGYENLNYFSCLKGNIILMK